MFEIIKLEIFNEFKDSNNEDIISNINKYSNSIFDFSMTLNENKYKLEEFDEGKLIPNKYSEENPKINLCKCQDEFIFFKDLKNKIKVSKEEKDNYITYFSDNFFCEKCGVIYPYKFIIHEKIFYLMDIILPINYKNYIILEYLNNELNIKTKIIHIINTNNEKGKIIGINIICVNDKNKNRISREQSLLLLNKGKFILKNISEKGTFVLIKNGFKITQKEINFQVGSFNFTAKIEEK